MCFNVFQLFVTVPNWDLEFLFHEDVQKLLGYQPTKIWHRPQCPGQLTTKSWFCHELVTRDRQLWVLRGPTWMRWYQHIECCILYIIINYNVVNHEDRFQHHNRKAVVPSYFQTDSLKPRERKRTCHMKGSVARCTVFSRLSCNSDLPAIDSCGAFWVLGKFCVDLDLEFDSWICSSYWNLTKIQGHTRRTTMSLGKYFPEKELKNHFIDCFRRATCIKPS